MEIKNSNTISPMAGEKLNKANNDAKAKVENNSSENAATQKAHNQGVNVSLSQEAREMKVAREKAFEIAMNTPDVRQDKVADIKARIQNGTYKVDSGKVADGMLREAIKDHLAMSDR